MNKIVKATTGLAVLTSVVGLSLAAFAGHHSGDQKDGMHKKGHKMERMLEKMDADKDGSISQDEFLKKHLEKFEKHDTNNDGSISKEEFDAHHVEKFKKYDKDSDGNITKDEMKSWKKDHKKKYMEKEAAE